jgi:acyl-coenzyme A thioesterase PaaI-like protein
MRGRGDGPETEGVRVRDPAFEARVRESFGRQRLMEFIGARLRQVAPGKVEIEAPVRKDLSQQHGYLHAGVVTALIDSACGPGGPSPSVREAVVTNHSRETTVATIGVAGPR